MMKSCKPYEPTISRRKLHNLTEITEKNIGKVQGQLTKFFSKPTVTLQGFCQKKIGEDIEYVEGFPISHSEYSEEYYPVYVPYEGHVDVHYLWKKHLAGENLLFSKEEKDIPRLAISTKYRSSCVPISIGDRYKLYGNRLVIMYKWDKFVHHTPWLRFREFIHVDSYDPEEIRQHRINGAVSILYDDAYYVDEYIDYAAHVSDRMMLRNFADDLVHEVCRCATKLLTNYTKERSCTITHDGQDYFVLVIKVDKALDPNNDEDYYELTSYITGKRYTSICSAITDVIDAKLEEMYSHVSEEDSDFCFEDFLEDEYWG